MWLQGNADVTLPKWAEGGNKHESDGIKKINAIIMDPRD